MADTNDAKRSRREAEHGGAGGAAAVVAPPVAERDAAAARADDNGAAEQVTFVPGTDLIAVSHLVQCFDAVGRILVGADHGSCFLVTANESLCVFTNNHVLPTKELARTARVLFSGSSPVQLDPDAVFFTSDKALLDYTLVGVDASFASGSTVRPLRLAEEDIAINTVVRVVGFPQDLGRCESIGTVTATRDDFVVYTNSSDYGSSGGPVLFNNTVAAIHHERVPGEALNKGVKISSILRDVALQTAALQEAALQEAVVVRDDKTILTQLFQDTNGSVMWKKHAFWGTSESLAEWHGVSINAQGRVTHLSLLDNGIRAPASVVFRWISQLSCLEFLDLAFNGLTGVLRGDTFRSLPNLRVLDLGKNNLSGAVPSSLASLVHLETLYLNASGLDVVDNARLSSGGHMWYRSKIHCTAFRATLAAAAAAGGAAATD